MCVHHNLNTNIIQYPSISISFVKGHLDTFFRSQALQLLFSLPFTGFLPPVRCQP